MRQVMHVLGFLILLVGTTSACARDESHGTIDFDTGTDVAASSEAAEPEPPRYDPPMRFAPEPTIEVHGDDFWYDVHETSIYYFHSESAYDPMMLEAAAMDTGEVLWSRSLPQERQEVRFRGVADPIVAEVDGTAVLYTAYALILSGTGTEADREVVKVAALDAATGEDLWVAEIGAEAFPGDYEGGLAYSGSYGWIDIEDADAEHVMISSGVGDEWTYTLVLEADGGVQQVMTGFIGAYLTADGGVVGRETSRDPYLWAYEVQGRTLGGAVEWSMPEINGYASDLGNGMMTAYADPDLSFTAGVEPLTVIADAATGDELVRFDFTARCFAADETIAVCRTLDDWSESYLVFAVDLGTGETLWSIDQSTPGRVAPTVTAALHGAVYGSVDGESVILDAATGQDLAVEIGLVPTLVVPGFGIRADWDAEVLSVHPATG